MAKKAVRRASSGSGLEGALDNYFGLTKARTNVRTEVIAGMTTFLAMAYIIVVNPQILGDAGMDKGSVFVATCLASAIFTLMMGLYANYPIALAPGMGLNAFFTYTIVVATVATYKFTWQQALAAVFLSGVLFFLISVFKIREYIINAIPMNLKIAISAGVGFFLAIIAMQSAGIIGDHPATLVTLNDLRIPKDDLKRAAPWLAILGFVLIVSLNYRKIPGATLIGMIIVSLIGIPLGITQYVGVVGMPPSIAPTFLKLDFSRVFELSFIVIVLTLLLVDLFDNAGTLIGVTHRAGLLNREGKLPRMQQALISDSFAAMGGSLLGTSTTTSYIESSAGVQAGGRTGLTAAVVAICFLLSLFFLPLVSMIPAYASAAALLYVACLMARGMAELDWRDVTDFAPAVVTAIAMPLTYSIADGIGFGFITYALCKIFSGRLNKLDPVIIILAAVFAVKFFIK